MRQKEGWLQDFQLKTLIRSRGKFLRDEINLKVVDDEKNDREEAKKHNKIIKIQSESFKEGIWAIEKMNKSGCTNIKC